MANRRWVTNGEKYDLLFTPFNDEICILSFCQDKDDPTCFWYVSESLNVEHDCEFADSIEEAKELFEEKYFDHIQDEIAYYETISQRWEEL